MRGSRGGASKQRSPDGIIPAYAGLTEVLLWDRYTALDHPRVCGAHSGEILYIRCIRGSSPRMRGSLVDITPQDGADGIIPAYAGLTNTSTNSKNGSRDHPRVCGAHLLNARFSSFFSGSSPRMRGSRHRAGCSCWYMGIIPAHAGLTDYPGQC